MSDLALFLSSSVKFLSLSISFLASSFALASSSLAFSSSDGSSSGKFFLASFISPLNPFDFPSTTILFT